jgi:hypothetical protein
MSTSNEDNGRQIVPLATVLQQINRGAAHTHASDQLQQLVQAVTDTGKKGSLTITIVVEPMKGAKDALTVTAQTTVKKPELQPVQASVFFADGVGNLTRNDPRQIQAPLHEVGTARIGESA